jgi:hypothetical protein
MIDMPPLFERISQIQNPITITDTRTGDSRTTTPLADKINAIASGAGEKVAKAGMGLADKINELAMKSPLGKAAGVSVAEYDRPNKFTRKYGDEEREVTLGTLFGEVSNRESEKQMIEARTILNIAKNRAMKNKTTIIDELKKPNQFQAYGGKEYNRYISKRTRATDKQKIEAITKALQELEEGTLEDNTGGSLYYIHKDDGSILATPEYLYGKQSTGPAVARQ